MQLWSGHWHERAMRGQESRVHVGVYITYLARVEAATRRRERIRAGARMPTVGKELGSEASKRGRWCRASSWHGKGMGRVLHLVSGPGAPAPQYIAPPRIVDCRRRLDSPHTSPHKYSVKLFRLDSGTRSITRQSTTATTGAGHRV